MGKRKNKRPALPAIAWGEADRAVARGVCDAVERCSPWAAKPRGFIDGALCAWCVVAAVVAVFVLAVLAGVKA